MKVEFIPRPIAEIAAAAERDAGGPSELQLGARAEGVRDQTVLEGVTTDDGVEVRVALAPNEAGRFLLGHQYLLEALDGGLGGVAPHTQAFGLDQPRAEVRARLHLQGEPELHWLGPLDASARPVEHRGDGEVLSEETRLAVIGVIPFTLTLRRTALWRSPPPRPAGRRPSSRGRKLPQGEEYVLQTGWAPQAISRARPADMISLQMERATSPPPLPKRGTRDVRVRVLGPDGRARKRCA